MAGRFSVEAVFKAVDRVTAPVTRMQNRVGKFTRSMSRGLGRVDRAVGKMSRGMVTGFKAATVAMVGLGAAAFNVITTGADFGRAIGAAAAKFPEQIKRGTDEFRALEDAARDVGRTTEFTATQAAKGLNFLAKAGFSAKFSIEALPEIIDFATASEIEFAEAADIASDALGSFGLNSEDAGQRMVNLRRIMDVMSKTANSTNTSVGELFESIKDGAPISTAAGVSMETFAATMGFLASNGIKAGKAGTAAKNITLALAGVGNKAAVTFKALGISLSDSSGDLRDQFDVMDDLRRSLKRFGDQGQIDIIAKIFGKIPIAAATKLLADTTGSVRKLREELEAAGGSSKITAKFIRNDVKGSLDGLSSAIEGVKISIFTLNEGVLKDTIDKMTEWVRANEALIATSIGDFIANIVENFDKYLDRVKLIGKSIAIFIALTLVLKTLVTVLMLVNLVMAANPITLIVLGVIALIAAFSALIIWIDDIAAGFDSLPGFVQAILAPIGLLIKAIQFIKENFGAIQSAASAVGSFLGLTGDASEDGADGIDGVSAQGAQIVSPQDRVARSIEERRETSTAEVTLTTGPGVDAEVTQGQLGASVQLQPSGAF